MAQRTNFVPHFLKKESRSFKLSVKRAQLRVFQNLEEENLLDNRYKKENTIISFRTSNFQQVLFLFNDHFFNLRVVKFLVIG